MVSLHDQYSGSDSQWPYRNHKLGAAGEPIHVPGVINPPPASNIAFGKPTDPKNYSAQDCCTIEPQHPSYSYDTLVNTAESGYHRSKKKLGAVPDGVAVIPESLLDRGFGIGTRSGESVGAIVQRTLCDTPLDARLKAAYQTQRNYNWKSPGINPITHTFGVPGGLKIDHVTGIMNYDHSSRVVETAVDRAVHNRILPDPDPLDPKPSIIAHTKRADQLTITRDPSELPPAGLATRSDDFTIGDTFGTMGLMTSVDADYDPRPKTFNIADHITHGIKTPPNPFPNPLFGPGRYAQLGLTDEDFLKLRDRQHVIPIMVLALALSETEARDIFDAVAGRLGRDLISVAEFHDEFKRLTFK
jgi:hypothetical protein